MVVDGVAHSLGDREKCRKFFAKLRDDSPREYARYVVDLAKQFIPRPVEVSGEISHAHKLPPVLEEKLIAVYGTTERA